MTIMASLPTSERLLELIDAMAGQPVLMAVDLVADRFIHGSPKRISREAPVLILRYEGEELVPGGGANAVANVAALDGRALPVGVVGRDEHGDRLLAALQSRGITTEGIARLDDLRTPTKIRLLAGGRHAIKQQVVRYDIEDSVAGRVDAQDAIVQAMARWAGHASVAVLSDYGYGAVSSGLVTRCRAAVGSEGTILCDSRYQLQAFRGLDGATPNEEEARKLLGSPLGEDLADVTASCGALRDRLGTRFLLVTRGGAGMALATADGCAHIPIHGSDEVADVTGAGDTVIGTFALSAAAGATPLEATLLANFAGGIVVMKRGTATVSRDELRAAVHEDAGPREGLVWVSS